MIDIWNEHRTVFWKRIRSVFSNFVSIYAMNNKTIELSSLKDFDDVSGEYKITCVCGAVTVIRPDQLLENRVHIQCKGCYLQYEIRVSGAN